MAFPELRLPRTLLWGMGLSMLVHVLVLLSPGWSWPEDEASLPAPVLSARLVTVAPAAPPSASAPRPKPAPRSATPRRELRAPVPVAPEARPAARDEVATVVEPAAEAEPALPPDAAEPAAESAPSPEPLAEEVLPAVPVPPAPEELPDAEPIIFLAAAGVPVGSRWPHQGEVHYDVLYGEGGFPFGTAIHRWSHDGQRYRMESVAEASGLFSALKSLSYTQRSAGEVLPQGLRPRSFEVVRGGARREWSEFDWEKGEVALFRDGKPKQASLSRGDQDVLTLWHQIGFIEPWVGPIVLKVVTGKSIAPSRVEHVGDETVQVPAGSFTARHLRAAAIDGSLTLDVWLAADQRHVPVRIRMRDRKGDVLEQHARSISFAAVAEAPVAEPEAISRSQ